MDKLYERAEVFNRLLNIQYNIILGKKGKTTPLHIFFSKQHFHHLIGLQRLKDLPQLNKDREIIFNRIINNEITYIQIKKSESFNEIRKRFESFIMIERALDNNGLFFKFNQNLYYKTKMEAEYIIESMINDEILYICIDCNNENKYFIRSFFPKDDIDYTLGHSKHTLLYKEKIFVDTQEKIVQYDKLTILNKTLN